MHTDIHVLVFVRFYKSYLPYVHALCEHADYEIQWQSEMSALIITSMGFYSKTRGSIIDKRMGLFSEVQLVKRK